MDLKRDPGIARNGQHRRFHGISIVSQLGNPADGGFGVLPIRQHVWARHAMWALKLVKGLAVQLLEVPPWVLAARVALSLPMRRKYTQSQYLAGNQQSGNSCNVFHPFVECLYCSSSPHLIINTFTPGNWCASAPLWHNPLLEIKYSGPPLHETYTLLHMMGIETLVKLTKIYPRSRSTNIYPTESNKYDSCLGIHLSAQSKGFGQL